MGDYYTVRPCAQIEYISESDARSYPACNAYFDSTNRDAQAVVHANFQGSQTEIGAALGVPFGTGVWLALAIHAIGVEIYVSPDHIHVTALCTRLTRLIDEHDTRRK